MEDNSPVLPLFLFPNIEYLSVLSRYSKVFIEERESFIKQSFRNRFYIYSASGELGISVPIIKQSIMDNSISNAEILYSDNWNKKAYRAIESAYGKSCYFEYFADEIKPFFFNEYKRLVDLNYDVFKYFLKKWEINTELKPTEEFKKNYKIDFRNGFNTSQYRNFPTKEYYQCFSEKLGFINNLSCLDLLFNEGKEGRKIILD